MGDTRSLDYSSYERMVGFQDVGGFVGFWVLDLQFPKVRGPPHGIVGLNPEP